MTKLLSAIAATAILALCAPACAADIDVKFGDGVKLPSGLKWQKASVTSKNKKSKNFGNLDPQKQDMLYALWVKELEEKRQKELKETYISQENIIFAEIPLNGVLHRFSALDAFDDVYSGCKFGDFREMWVCKWRYDRIDDKTGEPTRTQYFSMCANFADGETIEFAVDEKKSTIYFTVNDNGDVFNLFNYCATSIRIK